MAYRHVKVEVVPLTQKLAEEFSNMGRGRGERPFKHERHSFLQVKLENGKLYPPRWRTCYVRSTGETLRLDGQHSSYMLANCNGSFPNGMVVIIDRFECDTPDDLDELFNEFDSRKSARTPSDMVVSTASRYEELDDVKPMVTTRILNGLAFVRAITEDDAAPNAKTISIEERAKNIHRYRDFIVWCAEFASASALKWDCVIAAIYMTYVRDKDAAQQFWRMVRDESGEFGSASRSIAKVLRELDSVSNDRKSDGNRRMVYVKCLHAWNAHRENRTTRLCYHQSTATPDVV